ncbi:MAG: ATP-binding protein [Planctomycetota bacterium]
MSTASPRKLEVLELLAGASSGKAFFEIAARAITMTIGSQWGGIATQHTGPDGMEIRVLALCNEIGDNLGQFSFNAKGTPCGVLNDPLNSECTLFIDSDVQSKFPECQPLIDLNAESYWGESFYNDEGKIGHVFAIHSQSVEKVPEREALFRLIAQRVGSEYFRWQAEDGLKQAMRIIRCSRDHIHIVDENLTCRFASATLAEFIGRNEDELIGQHAKNLFMGQDFDDLAGFYQRALDGEKVSTVYAFDRDGRKAWFSLHLLPLDESKNRQVVAIARDITDQTEIWESQIEVATSSDVLSGKVQQVADRITAAIRTRLKAKCVGVFSVKQSPQGTILEKESASCEDCCSGGLTPIAESPLLRPLLAGETLILNGEPAPFLLDNEVPASLLAVPVSDGRDIVAVLVSASNESRNWTYLQQLWTQQQVEIIAQVISNRNRQELEKHIALDNKLESLGALAGGMAHDINNLLVPVLYGLELATFDSGNLDESVIESLELAKKATMNASDFCSQFLALGRDRSPESKPVNVQEIANLAIDLQAEFLEQQKVEILLQQSNLNQQLVFSGVPTLLRQAINNLIRNSVDSMREGDPRQIKIGIERVVSLPNDAWQSAKCDPTRTFVKISVTDQGQGMDRLTLDSAVEPFFTTKSHGKGLGLTVVQNAVKAHCGAMRILSQPERGSTFELYLPEYRKQVTSTPMPQLPKLRMLLVDDNHLVRGSMTRSLESYGHTVIAVASGQEAIKIVSEQPVDVAIIDYHMNDLSGPETLKALRQIEPDLPAIGISGYAQIWPENEIPVLQKPFQSHTLLERLQQLPELVNRKD